MLGLNPYVLIAAGIAWAASMAGAGWAGHSITSNAWKAQVAEDLKTAEKERDALQSRLNEVSTQYETAKAKRNVVTRIIYRQADAWVADHPTATCLDPSGVQLVNSAIAPAADSRRPDPAVPGSEPAR
jgi:hypothetical protein